MTTSTTRRFASGVAVASAIALSPALPAAAANTSTVTIVAQESFGEVGSFRAVGGGLCATGSTGSPGGTTVTERRRTLTFDLEKTFTCADGSSTFTVEIRAWYLPCRPSDRGVWTVVRGTGDYEGLSGHGQLVGTYDPGPCDDAAGITDVMTGRVSVG